MALQNHLKLKSKSSQINIQTNFQLAIQINFQLTCKTNSITRQPMNQFHAAEFGITYINNKPNIQYKLTSNPINILIQ